MRWTCRGDERLGRLPLLAGDDANELADPRGIRKPEADEGTQAPEEPEEEPVKPARFDEARTRAVFDRLIRDMRLHFEPEHTELPPEPIRWKKRRLMKRWMRSPTVMHTRAALRKRRPPA